MKPVQLESREIIDCIVLCRDENTFWFVLLGEFGLGKCVTNKEFVEKIIVGKRHTFIVNSHDVIYK